MPQPAADRNLLFGILALQMDFIDRDQLVAAMHAWVLDKTKALGDILVAQGALAPKRLALLDTLVEEHLSQHGNDPGQSLVAVGAAGVVRAALSRVADPGVRATLAEALGESHGREAPAPESTGAYQPTATPCARYVLLRPHAEGGLGEVFVARDEELHRDVALKQIQARYAEDPVSRARFVLEAEVTGNLEHPGIVPVYGFGQYQDGRPYYAMRFVKGDSLKEAIHRFHRTSHAGPGPRSLEWRKLLTSFVAVCQAIHYAHSRGVLHRDLKPDNIMLGKFGEVLVIDWGLAKPLDRPGADAERSLTDQLLQPALGGGPQTEAGATLGTPAYMAPEQAEGRLEHLTSAADVYSLGATLYCLLTGRAPFRGDKAEVLQQVRAGNLRPPREVSAHVPAALDAVCLKAMARKPEDRYSSARDLATDLEHWLADEPVAAHREPAATRLTRWGRRHRPLVAGAAALLLTAVVALASGLVLLGQVGARTEQQRRRAEENFAEAQRQRDLARANFQMARGAGDDYFSQVSESTLLKSPLPGLQPLRKQLLESALKYYQEFVRQGGDDPDLQAELAQAYFRVGSITEEIGPKADALSTYQRARDLYQALAQGNPHNASFRGELARTYRGIGRVEGSTGRMAEAGASYQQAIDLGEALAGSHPDVPEFQSDLAWSYNNLGIVKYRNGQAAVGRRSLERAITTWKRLIDKHPRAEFRIGLGNAYSSLGWNLTLAGRLKEALEANQQAVALNEEVVRENGTEPQFRRVLAISLDNLGSLYYYSGQPTKAREAFERALAVAEPLARENPAVILFWERLILFHIDLGHVLLHTGADADAQRSFDTAFELGKKLPSGSPREFSYAYIHRGLGKLLRKRGKSADALEALQKAVEIGEKTPGAKPYSTYELACARRQTAFARSWVRLLRANNAPRPAPVMVRGPPRSPPPPPPSRPAAPAAPGPGRGPSPCRSSPPWPGRRCRRTARGPPGRPPATPPPTSPASAATPAAAAGASTPRRTAAAAATPPRQTPAAPRRRSD
jgi:serine/threonine-protein kinase